MAQWMLASFPFWVFMALNFVSVHENAKKKKKKKELDQYLAILTAR